MGTYILDKKQVLDFRPDPKAYNVLIRITNPNGKFTDLKNENDYREIITLQFFDLEDESTGLYLFNDNHLAKLVDFFTRHKHSQNMVIHCDEGRSRSAGVAVGWFLFNDAKSSIYKLYHDKVHYPNYRVAEAFFRHFKADMRLLKKWEKELRG